jgi:outer membrane protein
MIPILDPFLACCRRRDAARMAAAMCGSLAALLVAAEAPSAQSVDLAAPVELPAATSTAATGTRYALGAGVGLAPDYEGSDDYRIVPFLRARAGNLYGPTTFVELLGTRITSNLVPHPHFRLGPMLQYIPKRGSVDNNRVDDLENVDPAVMLGATAGWDFVERPSEGFGLFLEGRGDVANGHGWLVTPGLRGRYGLARGTSLAGSLTTTWGSEDYMSDYFGIDAADARRSGLDQHDADAGFKDVAIGGAVLRDLTERLQVGLLARYARLLGDAADSPIVDDEGSANQFFAGLLVGVRF